MTDTNTAEREAFKAAHQHLDLVERPDAWGRPVFRASHVEAIWEGWQARASLAASAGSVPVAPVAPPMDGEIALIEKAVKRAGITSLLNHGAASCVFTEGCDGVSQEHLLAYTREIALHCAVALGSPPEGMAGWIDIATPPMKPDANVAFESTTYLVTDGTSVSTCDFARGNGAGKPWASWSMYGGIPVRQITHWMPTPALPAPPLPASEAKEL